LAYFDLQATKPQSLGFGLADSPAGLAAWIAEKWRGWTDCGGDLYSVVERDDLLANLFVYWFTNTITSASRLYYESRVQPVRLEPGERADVPAGFLLESPDARGAPFLGVERVGAPPRACAEAVFDVRRWHETAVGGHFPALETPELLVAELREFFRPLRGQ
jgi:pimeloyl-ACP methyl ester carboxylesterase